MKSSHIIDMKKYGSLILPLLLIIIVVACAAVRFNGRENPRTGYGPDLEMVIILVYVLWLFHEMKVSRPDFQHEKKSSDFGTREFYGLGHALTIFSALWFDPLRTNSVIAHWAGAALFLSGIAFRTWAIETLGVFYSHAVNVMEDHKIINTGPYRFIRHPAYTGMLAAHAGIVIFFFNWITLAVYLAVLIPAVIVRILVEERTLLGIPGYVDFAKSRRRLLPCIW
jgi:protein-S-isoprenylcysteine O-methyltransferase Ste14